VKVPEENYEPYNMEIGEGPGILTSSKGAKPVPYRLMPRTSPRACLKAVPSAMALSCAYGSGWITHYLGLGIRILICSMVVINPEIAFTLHGQGHPAVFCQSGVHLEDRDKHWPQNGSLWPT
jgi:hypothetical protein